MGPEFNLISFADQWGSAKPRWMDIGDFVYSTGFKSTFISAQTGTITLKYDSAPTVPYFVGEIKAQGLKPNFCYQMKLMGKPGTNSGGGLWGTAAGMAANETLLRAGRWWNYKTEDPAFTTTNDRTVLRSADYKAGWVAGYLYFGYFVTNEYGSTDAGSMGDGDPWTGDFIPIAANHSYHITWKTGQSGTQSTAPITYTIVRTTDWGYESIPSGEETEDVALWFEKESDDPMGVTLPAGTYDVVLMITEESFHSSGDGGCWLTVRVSDWPTINSPKTGQPWVSARGSSIVFTVGGGGGGTMTATVNVTLAKAGTKWQANAWVTVTDKAGGAAISSASVTGNWSGAYNQTGVSGSTGSDGIARFTTPRVSAKSGATFTFTVTNVVKSGHTWDGVQNSDTETVP
jgi:hypothetical protein